MRNRHSVRQTARSGFPSQPESPDEGLLEILDAAADCFMRRGFDATSIDEIAAKLGSTKGRIYHHFRSKADLFFEVFSLSMVTRLTAVMAAYRTKGTGAERLSRMAHAHLMNMMENVPYQRVANQGIELLGHGALTPEQRERLQEIAASQVSYEDLFKDVMRDGIADGSLSVADIALASKAIFGAMNWLSKWYSPAPDESEADRDYIATTIAATFMQGMLSRAAPSSEGLTASLY
jgi:AcrR family transcriptional regulator